MKTKVILGSIDVTSRRKRKAAVSIALHILEEVRIAEEAYLERVPLNLQGGDAYAITEEVIDILTDSIITLMSVYDY